MKKAVAIYVLLMLGCTFVSQPLMAFAPGTNAGDTVPTVFANNHADLLFNSFRNEAEVCYAKNELPSNLEDWNIYKKQLKNRILKELGVQSYPELSFNSIVTDTLAESSYSILNIAFQTRPGVFATANLYVPNGKGPFPAVLALIGHYQHGRVDEECQALGHTLAQNGYVCLCIDPWGAGERTTVQGVSEYHGANLGASLMNVGETLMGMQLTDNIRAVDFLCSLPYVDKNKMGATGASGGGNQTMWLSALDERIKAAVPVVSAGTFEAYVMRHNCICELLPDGLTFTEEAAILAMVAPRALKMCNHNLDGNAAFAPAEMMRSYDNAKRIYRLFHAENSIQYQLFNLEHGYYAEDRQAMLGWFNFYLKNKGTAAPVEEKPFQLIPLQKLLTFAPGKRPAGVMSTEAFCTWKGTVLRDSFLQVKNIDTAVKKNALKKILLISEPLIIQHYEVFETKNHWQRIALDASDGTWIPLLLQQPPKQTHSCKVIINFMGKADISATLIQQNLKEGYAVVLLDLLGTGEMASFNSAAYDSTKKTGLHTLSRAELWLGKTVMGEWVNELHATMQFLQQHYHFNRIEIDAAKDAGIAALFLNAIYGDASAITVRNVPATYLFDKTDGINYFSMGIHLPGFLEWGDMSLAAALGEAPVKILQSVTMSGHILSTESINTFQQEYNKISELCHQKRKTVFSEINNGNEK